MKTMKQISIIALLLITLIGCSSNDDDSPLKNQIKTNITSFDITESVLVNTGTNNDVTDFKLYFTSDGLTTNVNGDFNGKGDYLFLSVRSSENNKLADGTYELNAKNTNAFSIGIGSYAINYVANVVFGERPFTRIVSGTMSVSVQNDVYTITLDLQDENGNAVSGNYNGAITVYYAS